MTEATPEQVVAFMTNVMRSTPEQIITMLRTEIERLRSDRRAAADTHDKLAADNEQLLSLLFRVRNYIAGEHTLDRPKDAMLELIDAALKDAKP